MSVRVRKCRVSVGTFPVTSALGRDISGEVGLVSGRNRRGRVIEGT